MAEKAADDAAEDFAYLFEQDADPDPAQVDHDVRFADGEVPEIGAQYDDIPAIGEYEPPVLSWHHSLQARLAIGAIATAVVGIVVSSVLLLSGSSGTESVTPSTTHSTSPSARAVSSAPAPPPNQPPPAAPPAQSVTEVAPRQPTRVVAPPPPRPTKDPEIGVTRTPATRSPISVSPPKRGAPAR